LIGTFVDSKGAEVMTMICQNLAFPPTVREGLDKFCNQLQEALGENLVSITLYGGLAKGEYSPTGSNVNIMIVLKDVNVDLLEKAASPVRQGMRDLRLSIMVLSEEDLQLSTDVFPTKFLDMQRYHQVLWGKDLLAGLSIARDHIRLRCEQEIKNLLLRLRSFYLQRLHRPELIEGTLTGAVSSFLSDLSTLLILKTGESPAGKSAIADMASHEFGLDKITFQKILEMKYGTYKPDLAEMKTLYNDFMTAVQRAAQIVDKFE
jgi:hypothetical protein